MKYGRLLSVAKALKARFSKKYLLVAPLVIVLVGVCIFAAANSHNSHVAQVSKVLGVSTKSTVNTAQTMTVSSNSSDTTTSATTNAAMTNTSTRSVNTTKTTTHTSSNSNSGTTPNTGTNGGNNPPAPTPELLLSTYNITLGNSLADPSAGSVPITFSSNAGPISQPTQTVSKLAQAEIMGVTPHPLSSAFQSQWTFDVARLSIPAGGSDVITFTAKTESGVTITANLNVTLVTIPSFYTVQGPLTKVINSDGTVTVTALITLVPSANFGNPLIHVCDDTNYGGNPAANPCNPADSYTETYAGNNTIKVTNTVPSTSHRLSVQLWADGVYGHVELPWSF